jgi:hypothetical protein
MSLQTSTDCAKITEYCDETIKSEVWRRGYPALKELSVKPTSGKAQAITNAMVNSQDTHASTQANNSIINNTNVKSDNEQTVTMTTRLAVG